MNSERERERKEGKSESTQPSPLRGKNVGELTSGVVERGPENDACGSGTVDKE